VLLEAVRAEAAADLVQHVQECERLSKVIQGLDAESGRLQTKIEWLRAEAIVAAEMRHDAVQRALDMARAQGRKIVEVERARAAQVSAGIIGDAERVSGRLMAGAEAYAAAMRCATVDDVLENMKRPH
jgi:hypothetical protein